MQGFKILSSLALAMSMATNAFGQQLITINPGSSIMLEPNVLTTVQCTGSTIPKTFHCQCVAYGNDSDSYGVVHEKLGYLSGPADFRGQADCNAALLSTYQNDCWY